MGRRKQKNKKITDTELDARSGAAIRKLKCGINLGKGVTGGW